MKTVSAGQINSRPQTVGGGVHDSSWRTPPGCDGYLMHAESRELWSEPREVPAKGGSTRKVAAKLIKPSRGRVSLSIDGVRVTKSADKLWQETFPELVQVERIEKYRRSIRRCANGHPLAVDDGFRFDNQGNILPKKPDIDPQIAYWGSYNRVCRLCFPDLPSKFDKGNYSRASGTSGVNDGSPGRAEIHRESGPADCDGVAEWLAEGGAGIETRPQ